MNRGEGDLSGPSPGPDAELLRLIRRLQHSAADEEAAERLFKRFYRWAYGIFRYRDVRRELAEELAQETLWRAFKEIGTLRQPEQFRAWLRSIAQNILRNERRRRQRLMRSGSEVSLDDTDDDRPPVVVHDKNPTPDEILLTRESWKRIWDAAGRFPPQMRQCFTLLYRRGMKYREIAAVLKISTNAVRSHLGQAKNRLKAELGAEVERTLSKP